MRLFGDSFALFCHNMLFLFMKSAISFSIIKPAAPHRSYAVFVCSQPKHPIRHQENPYPTDKKMPFRKRFPLPSPAGPPQLSLKHNRACPHIA